MDSKFRGDWKLASADRMSAFPESLNHEDYNWYKEDSTFKNRVMDWIASEFQNTYDYYLDLEILFWLELNNFQVSNLDFRLTYIFPKIFGESYDMEGDFETVKDMYLDYFLGLSKSPRTLEEVTAGNAETARR